VFNFSRVLMINPPLNLVDTVTRLDRMLEGNIPGGLENLDQFSRQSFRASQRGLPARRFRRPQQPVPVCTYRHGQIIDDAMLEAIIGADFRFSCINMSFSADVLTQAGYTC